MAKRFAPYLVSLCIMLFLAEVGSYGVGRFLQRKQRIFVPPSPPPEGARAFEEYMQLRDPELGWPYEAQFGSDEYDSSGARPTPAFLDPEEHPTCVSLFGDSFTEGGEVAFADSWGNQLSIKLGCRVANFGQGGYGTDQGYLRYLKKGGGPEKVVFLGHMTENIVRMLTRDRDLVAPVLYWAMKPRFIVNASGALELVPIPTLTKSEAFRLIGYESPQYDLPHESFHPGGPAGAQRLEFPFSLALAKSFGDYRMQALFQRVRPYVPLYAPDHPLGGLEVIVGVQKAFLAKAKERGQHPILFIFPMDEDVRLFLRDGKWPYQPLLDRLAEEKIEVLDFGPKLLELTREHGAHTLYKAGGHYNEMVNLEVAQMVFDYLEARGHPERLATKTSSAAPSVDP